ncbi:hypothetical protein SAMN06265348_11463 [Pedobacter westerhofensis]|uniref:Uncharacterized protein n=1 Tax=Pedobacter westerhofensis TaxID=425512 RepID=A0A521FMX8_9SPHI|nr:hypothetical protein [Pedobacter westerhofensis]SMO97484.1 hypothetical protein SAMN06265348_11463 [Pedobacter westerhofensis]
MATRIINLCYRKIIDANAAGIWEQLVFNDTYTEFLMQAQYYNQEKKYTSLAQLVLHVPDAERLHFLVSAACIEYLQQLNERIPDIYNILGNKFLNFKSFHFEIINSDITQRSAHQVAINFYSEPLIWHDSIGSYLLVSQKDAKQPELTDLVKLVPFLSINSLKIIP